MADNKSSEEGKAKAKGKSVWLRRAHRIEHALLKAGISDRHILVSGFDRNSHFEDIRGIGPVLGEQLRAMLDDYGPIEWDAAMPGVPSPTPDATPEEDHHRLSRLMRLHYTEAGGVAEGGGGGGTPC